MIGSTILLLTTSRGHVSGAAGNTAALSAATSDNIAHAIMVVSAIVFVVAIIGVVFAVIDIKRKK